jgi:hypothetical protein
VQKELNFFQRRKILKKTNFLDLTPIRLLEHDLLENGRIDIMLPRFKNRVLSNMFQPRKKGPVIRIHLDINGSAIWQIIDGKVSVQHLCDRMRSERPELMQPPEETEKRVTGFLSLLYRERYITFREILPEKEAGDRK